MCDQIVHVIFAFKYWVLSRRILHIRSKKQDNWFDFKVRFCFGLLIVFIISTSIANFFCGIKTDGQFRTTKGYIFSYALLCVTPYFSFSIMAEALWKLKSCKFEGFSISNVKIIIQIIAGFIYALSNTCYLLLPMNFKLISSYIDITMDSISQFTLIYTLQHIAVFQFNHQVEQTMYDETYYYCPT